MRPTVGSETVPKKNKMGIRNDKKSHKKELKLTKTSTKRRLQKNDKKVTKKATKNKNVEQK